MPARLAICSHCLLSICNFLCISHFGFTFEMVLLLYGIQQQGPRQGGRAGRQNLKTV